MILLNKKNFRHFFTNFEVIFHNMQLFYLFIVKITLIFIMKFVRIYNIEKKIKK